MSKRRGHHEGSIRQRADGTWEARISLPSGKRPSFYGKTRKEVQDKLRAALRDVDAGLDLGTSKQTVAAFLTRWLSDVIQPTKARKTYVGYADIVRLHLIPGIGHHELGKLKPEHVAGLLKAKQDAGLAPRTVHHIRATLRTALNQAVRWGMISRNVAALVSSPRQSQAKVTPLSAAEARALLDAAEGDRLAVLFRVALTLGLRQGEVLGLRWSDVDFARRSIRVQGALQRIDGALALKEPKTEKSRRTLTAPASLLDALRAHQDRQAFERAFAGDRWQESGYIFTTTIGTPVDPRNAIRSWHRIQRQRNVRLIERGYRAANGIAPDIALTDAQAAEVAAIQGDAAHPLHVAHAAPLHTFHSTRHTAASLMLAEGVPVKVVQEVLGHSLLSTTADTYGHLFPEAFDQAADAMERALAGEREGVA